MGTPNAAANVIVSSRLQETFCRTASDILLLPTKDNVWGIIKAEIRRFLAVRSAGRKTLLRDVLYELVGVNWLGIVTSW